jgi:mycothiol synthase
MGMVFRPVAGIQDAHAMAAVQAARMEADSVIPGLGFEECPSASEIERELEDSDPLDWVVVEDVGRIVGYGHCLHDWDEAENRRCYLHLGFVMPEFRDRGLGTELVKALEARCLAKARLDDAVGRSDLGANASGTEISSQKLLRDSGYEILYTALQMELATLNPVGAAPLSGDFELRPVDADHHRAIWQMIGDAYFDPLESHRGAELGTEGRFHTYFEGDPSLMFVAWHGSRVAGAVLARSRGGVGVIYEVSVGHWHRRRGLGRALLTRAINELLCLNPSAVRIVTKKEFPTQAWRLYESVGFRTIKAFPRWRKPMALLAPKD